MSDNWKCAFTIRSCTAPHSLLGHRTKPVFTPVEFLECLKLLEFDLSKYCSVLRPNETAIVVLTTSTLLKMAFLVIIRRCGSYSLQKILPIHPSD